MTPEHLVTLESLVDSYGLEGVLYALGDICAEKAEHLATNWQDMRAANEWSKRCLKITRAADAVR